MFPIRLQGKVITYAQGKLYLVSHVWKKNRHKAFINKFTNKVFAYKREESEGKHRDNYVQNEA
jgi:hypothetical protein